MLGTVSLEPRLTPINCLTILWLPRADGVSDILKSWVSLNQCLLSLPRCATRHWTRRDCQKRTKSRTVLCGTRGEIAAYPRISRTSIANSEVSVYSCFRIPSCS